MLFRIYVSYDFTNEDKEKISQLFSKTIEENFSDYILHETDFLHSTIEFIGETKISKALELKKMIENLDISDVNLKITGKILRHNKYLALEIENNEILQNIHSQVMGCIKKNGLVAKNKHYLPHISLGKMLSENATLSEDIDTEISFNIKPMLIAVYRSVDYAMKI